MSIELIIGLSAIGGSLMGALVTAIITFVTKKDETSLGALKTLIESIEARNDKLEKEVHELRDEVKKYERDLIDLQQTVQLLESSHQDSPIPMWIKDTNGIMLSLNSAYEELFLIPRGKAKKDYIFENDHAVWERDIAFKFEANDKKVLKSKQVWHGKEEVIYDGKKQKWRVIKYPRYSGRTVIGIAGICIPPEGVEVN